jgi:high-affinity iron transporter
MGKSVFSVPIFFIVFRETLEAAIIVSVLLGLVEQIAHETSSLPATTVEKPEGSETHSGELAEQPVLELDDAARKQRFIRRMRWQIFAGSFLGFFIALSIGAAFIAVWFTQASDLWAKSEELWEGGFSSLRESKLALNLLLTMASRYI